MALENKYGKSAVDATRRNALPPYLDELFQGGIGGAGVETHNITLTTSGWSNLQQNIVLTCGATGSSDIICAPDNTSMDADYYLSAFEVKLSNVSVVEGEEEGENTATFTFTATTTPTINIDVVIVIINASSGGGIPIATTSYPGIVKPDGTTITISSDGTIHSVGGGGGGGGDVSGVKGDAESTYRTGNVNITKANIGLGNVDNTSDADKPISTATQTALNNKVDKVAGKGLSTNDYTTAEKTKLAGIEEGAQVNTVTGVKGNAESSYRTGNINLTKANIGLGNVDNTSDANKPISTATQTALDNKVDKETGKGLSSNDFTDTLLSKLNGIESGAQVNTVTGVKGNSESSYRVGNVNITKANIGLGNVDNTSDANKPISTTTQTALDAKVDKVTGKGLSTNDFTDALLTKLNGIEAGAQVNSVTGVKGNAESTYRTGNINITKANIGLGNVDNTSDANKPISTATQTALDNKVDITDIATTSTPGLVIPDGTTITIDNDGTIHSIGGSGGSDSGLPTRLLWENPSPTSAFAAQVVTVDLSQYDIIAIDYLMVNNATVHCYSLLGVNGLTQRSIDGQQGSSNITTRDATPSATGVVFANGYLSATQNNIYMIPYRIYGVGGYGNSSVLYFTDQTVSVASNSEIFRITDQRITSNSVVLECTFANPLAISGAVSWTSYNGYIIFTGICTSATTANVTLNGASFNELYPTGSVVCMSTNTNPSTYYGGTWELIDKQFKYQQWLTASLSDVFTSNSGTTVGTFCVNLREHSICIERMTVQSTTAISETTVELGTFKLDSLGVVGGAMNTNKYFLGQSDGGNGIAFLAITTSGIFETLDRVTTTSGGTIAAGNNINFSFDIQLRPTEMMDSFCDKFYFKRTA